MVTSAISCRQKPTGLMCELSTRKIDAVIDPHLHYATYLDIDAG